MDLSKSANTTLQFLLSPHLISGCSRRKGFPTNTLDLVLVPWHWLWGASLLTLVPGSETMSALDNDK